MHASSKGHSEVVAQLLRQGVEVNTLSVKQRTALIHAYNKGCQEVAAQHSS